MMYQRRNILQMKMICYDLQNIFSMCIDYMLSFELNVNDCYFKHIVNHLQQVTGETWKNET